MVKGQKTLQSVNRFFAHKRFGLSPSSFLTFYHYLYTYVAVSKKRFYLSMYYFVSDGQIIKFSGLCCYIGIF